ncbi:hypothetical protein [Blastococcus brunescens]|uniref:DUF1622 domain-containing protein n=1 Tax=Blastococcus brunescens TaxID=1564165 RepID=A0ABZ1B2C0_9ACTN|nr:hypothetical protein [Blastococcus sp. BMG 8361]WRL63908.1 hypothetical protein U6N30_30600 [Blastococcus sp. BMG 8361]
MSVLAEVTRVAALGAGAAALVAGALALAVTRRPLPALAVLLDMLLAAGLLRLLGEPDWPAILTAATLVALRRLLSAALRSGVRARTAAAVQEKSAL